MQTLDIQVNALEKLFLNSNQHLAAKGEMITFDKVNDCLFLVTKGYIKRYLITKDGASSTQMIHGPGGIFPLTPIFRDILDKKIYEGREEFYYEAICDATYYGVDFSLLREELIKNPVMYRDLLKVSAGRIKHLIHTLENQAIGNSYNRVAHQLLYFARSFGVITPYGIKIVLPLTQSELASSLNLTRGTVALATTHLRQLGIIRTGRHIYIKDASGLEKEAYE